MKRFMRKFEAAMMAVAFAEADEAGTARQILREENRREQLRRTVTTRTSERKVLRAE
jgi:hypothetical protein